MKTATAQLKQFLLTNRQFCECDLYTVTPAGVASPLTVNDTFSGSVLGSNWTTNNGAFIESAGTCQLSTAGTGTRAEAWWNANSMNADQWAQCTILSTPAGGALGVAVRMASSGQTYYALYQTSATWYVFKFIAGALTVISSGSRTPSNGDILYLSIQGTTIVAKINGSTVYTTTDSSISSGQPGIAGSSTFPTSNAIDNWSAGNLIGGANIPLTYTSADIDIIWNTYTYTSKGPFVSRSAIKWGLGLTVDTMDITVDAKPTDLYLGQPILRAFAQGIFDGARVQLERIISTRLGDTSLGSVILLAGNIADVTELGRTRCKLQVRSRLELLNHPVPKNLFQPGCRWTLYDSGCGLAKAAFTFAATVASGSTAIAIKTNATAADGYYTLGTITFTSGVNAGLSATIKAYVNASGLVTLNVPLPAAPANGDTCSISAGCDHLMATCSSKFSNLVNFGGHPFVPVPEDSF